jgi:hypothetical protein
MFQTKINRKKLKIDQRGLRYGSIFRRQILLWEEIAEAGFYLEKVKRRDVHYMNFSTTPYLTPADKRASCYVLWLWVSKTSLSAKSAACLKRAHESGNCLLLPLWKRQMLPTAEVVERSEEGILSAFSTYAPQIPFYRQMP